MIVEPRRVGLKTIFDLVKQRRIHFIFGILFTIIPFFIGTTFLMIIKGIDSNLPDVDYDNVNKNGKLITATITDIETQSNVTINNEHPSIISYKYTNNDREIINQYRSLDSDRINRMNIGDTIKVRYLANSSIVVGLEPFEFPYNLLFGLLLPLLLVGLITLGILYLRIRNTINLYKSGELRQAEIVSMTPKYGLMVSGIGQGVTIHYQYKTTRGQSILGRSFSSDYSILNSKRQGEVIKIFVSRGNESKSCLIPKLDEIRNDWKIE